MNDSQRPWMRRRLHFVGVGGAGMSGYARAAHVLGASVSGSDRASSVHSERLRDEGVLDASIGHDAANVPDGEDVEIVYSSAVPADNPERLAARRRGLADRPRADLLAELSALRRTIAVAGAHGKTTTASMIVHLLREGGVDPGWLVGSSVGPGLANSHWSEGEWLVIEADESDRSMLSLDVEIALLTNVELDHHATFGSLEELREAFREFLALAQRAVVIWDRPDLLALLSPAAASGVVHVNGSDVDAVQDQPAPPARGGGAGNVEVVAYDVPAPKLEPGGSRFRWRGGDVRVTVPGAHNAYNAAGALEVARLVGLADSAPTAIAGFTGAARRFQHLGATASGALVIDDYAHHPTEVAATLTAARTLGPKRLIAVFQPHLYSRTALLADEFGAALAIADIIVLLDVYPARERAEDHPGIGGETLVHSTAAHAQGREVLWRAGFDEAQEALGELLEDGDLCVVMGAGDVDALGRRLVGDDGL
ncbi:MAG TPA: UDP-N-acetylmuramate--L-alanine ligase [Solirubrobacteraceae bacterium]|jgi:UDP-N-acetylmuramate--alanine ligase|nr:UDP-N-acetylmuramate--L-alanine ligase [Solirubrobacteraceae bacterium]